MAGRNISATHVAFTSTRVMATCAVMGQAMGTAAAYVRAKGLAPRANWPQDPARVRRLQQRLLRDDQTIRGRSQRGPAGPGARRRGDRLRLAARGRSAPRTCSTVTCAICPANGTTAGRRQLGTEARGWIWTWPKPQTLRLVQITFDTGFQRELTLSHQDSVNARIIRAPQPETVRDYELLHRPAEGGGWQSLGKFTGNYQRLRRHNAAAHTYGPAPRGETATT